MPVSYFQLIAGAQELSSTLVHLADSEDIPAFTPLMMNADSLMVPWDGMRAGEAVFLTPHLINSSTQQTAIVYKTGFSVQPLHN